MELFSISIIILDHIPRPRDACLDLWAKDFTSKIEVNIIASEVKIRAKISAYEVKSWAQRSRHASLPRFLR